MTLSQEILILAFNDRPWAAWLSKSLGAATDGHELTLGSIPPVWTYTLLKGWHSVTESMGPVYDAVEKLGEARQALEKSFNKSDCDAAKVIFDAMCAANLQYLDKANTVHRLAWASLLYAQAVLRQHMSAQATTQG